MTTNNPFDLTGRIACVTGASAGIGHHLSQYLVSQNMRVVGVARRADRMEALRDETGAGFDFVEADLANRDDFASTIQHIQSKFGDPDILINAAGINTREPADAVTQEGWDVTLSLNLTMPFFLAQALVPAMQKKEWGRIINIASLQSYRAFPAGISYGASKGAVVQMTRAMAEAWSSQGINANAIGPGFVETELTQAVFQDDERRARNAEQTCIGRNSVLADLEGPVHFLVSEASRYVTGQVLMVDGGFSAK